MRSLLVTFNKLVARTAVSTVTWVGVLVGGGILLTGFGVIAWQVFTWLWSAQWISISLLDALFIAGQLVPDEFLQWLDNPQTRLGMFLQWLDNPQSWLGIHKIVYAVLAHTPTSLLLIVVGGGILMGALWEEEHLDKENEV